MFMKYRLMLSLLILLGTFDVGQCERIKDIVDIQGIRGNILTGEGIVIGLAGTGDSTLPSRQMITNIFRDSGSLFTPSDFSGGNIAVVIITAELGPFAREGTLIDVTVSSVGDAESLQGGILLPAALKGLDGKGLDGEIYAIAQGPVSIGGWTASGKQASITKNHQTVGRIPGGATVEKAEIADFVEYLAGHRFITLNLRNIDFSTADRISVAINEIHPNSAAAVDAGTIKIKVPNQISQMEIAKFIDDITSANVKVDVPAIVVINERTGTIVVGENVAISEVAISQGSLVVKIKETPLVSQPTSPFSNRSLARTVVVNETELSVEEKDGFLIPISQTITVAELAKTLNAIGATPTDLIAIFNALKKAGALQAKLEIM